MRTKVGVPREFPLSTYPLLLTRHAVPPPAFLSLFPSPSSSLFRTSVILLPGLAREMEEGGNLRGEVKVSREKRKLSLMAVFLGRNT